MKTKLQSLLTNLNQGLIERDQTIKLALLTLLAGENMLLVGPPGTGKSLIARRMSESLAKNTATQNNDYFEYLLTKFSTPEEIFGPLSISELKQDRFKRNTAGYLPTVKMAFLDEIFKSSSSILNALLTILNERIYHNGAEVQPVPLRSLIAASNELPNEQEELSALYDRFLVRVFVDYVKEENRQQFFIPAEAFKIQPQLCITEQDLALIAAATAKIKIPDELTKVILNIWEKHKEAFKEDRREDLSDRRLTKVIQLLRVSAATNGRKEMDLSDVFLLKDCLWNHPDNAEQVINIINQELKNNEYDFTEKISESSNKSESNLAGNKIASKDSVVKGFEGSGTENDPLLIKSAQDLEKLRASEIGEEGYYFKQVADIDISNINNWSAIDFSGSYNGAGFSIIKNIENYQEKIEEIEELVDVMSSFDNMFNKKTSSFNNWAATKNLNNCQEESKDAPFSLFNYINKSNLKNLSLKGLMLALNLNESTTSNTSSNIKLINFGENSLVENCVAESILNIGKKCKIIECKSLGPLAFTSLSDCEVSDCMVILNEKQKYGIVDGANNTSIKNCYVKGKSNNSFTIAASIKNSSSITKTFSYMEEVSTIPENFNQSHFENDLGWDFKSIWVWDNQQNYPNLRNTNCSTIPLFMPNKNNLVDILTKQLQANIWI